jgi:hypothetical protein
MKPILRSDQPSRYHCGALVYNPTIQMPRRQQSTVSSSNRRREEGRSSSGSPDIHYHLVTNQCLCRRLSTLPEILLATFDLRGTNPYKCKVHISVATHNLVYKNPLRGKHWWCLQAPWFTLVVRLIWMKELNIAKQNVQNWMRCQEKEEEEIEWGHWILLSKKYE